MSLSARSYTFDAGVVSLYYAGAAIVKPYFDRVFSGRARGFVSEVNLAEFYYKSAQKFGLEASEIFYRQVRSSPITVVPPGEVITRDAGRWKLKDRGLSLADCFALATAESLSELLLTPDSGIKKAKAKQVVLIPI